MRWWVVPVLAALFCGLPSASAQPGDWLVLPVTTQEGAEWMEPTVGQVRRALRLQGIGVWSPQAAATAFERQGSAAPLPVSDADFEDSKPSPATEERSVEARSGRLTVIVFPRGNVWINGGPRGSAPLKNAVLKPGRYRVSAGQGKPTVTKTVRLRPGDRKQVNFDLTK